jgi:UDP-glucose 4-epimerase
MLKVLVTGSSGFIGTTFIEACSEAYEVHGLDRREPAERIATAKYHLGELSNADEVSTCVRGIAPQAIVHLAAQARVEPSFEDPVSTFRDNVLGTINLIRAALQLGSSFRKFLYASSETIYGPSIAYPTPETAVPNPQSPYAASKAAAEHLVRSSFDGRALILRSGMGYGPRSDPRVQVVAKFIQRALRDEALPFPVGLAPGDHPTRDLNFVSNFVDGARLALDSGVSGTFNVASGREISVLELAHEIVRKAGKGRIDFTPAYQYRRGEKGLRTWLDISKAKEAFGYSPRVDLDEGLGRTLQWMKSQPGP